MGRCRFSFSFLLLYVFGGFLITKMKHIPSAIALYGLAFLLLLSFLRCIKYSNIKELNIGARLWLPYLTISILGYTMFGFFRLSMLWIVPVLIIGISRFFKINENLPIKYIIYLGGFQVFALLLQLYIPSIYDRLVTTYYGEDFKEFGTGLQGFTEQTSLLASILLLTMATLLYYVVRNKKNWQKIIVVIIFVALIMLTGKRSFFLMAIMIPILIYLLSQKQQSAFFFVSVFLFLILTFALPYFVENAEQYSYIPGIEKIASTFSEEESDDVFNGREILWAAAIDGFLYNPVLGIGTGRYMAWTGFDTNAHNMYLQVLCEQGVVGLLFFVVPLFVCLVQTINLLKKIPQGIKYKDSLKFSLFVQFFFIIYGMSGNPTRNESCFLMYYIAIGILVDCYRLNLKENER